MISNIQLLRAVAAITILVHHLQWDMSDQFGTHFFGFAGRAGVDIFFVISGFIMFHTTREHDRPLPVFWTDRVIRIVPVYWAMTVLIIVLFFLGLKPSGADQVGPREIAAAFTFFPIISGAWDTMPLVDPGWTLIYEMYFYFLFGLTFFLKSQTRALIAMTAFFAITFILTRVGPQLPYAMTYLFEPITFEFAAGGALALLYRNHLPVSNNLSRIVGWTAIVVGSVTVFVTAYTFGPTLNQSLGLRAVMVGGPAVVIVAGALILEKAGVICRSPNLLFLGAASYSIYLMHEYGIIYTIRAFNALGIPQTPPYQLLLAVVGGGVGLGSGILLYLGFEKPVTRLLKTLSRRQWRTPYVSAE